MLQRDMARRAAVRAGRLGDHIRRILDDGGEPTPELLAEFNAAYAIAETSKLEFDFTASPEGADHDRHPS
jgi:hypothetical protein